MNVLEARSAALEYFASNIRSSMRTLLGGNSATGSSWTIDGATVYEWPTIRSWPNMKQWVDDKGANSDTVRVAIHNVGTSLCEAVVDGTTAESSVYKFVNQTAGTTKTVKRGGQTADSAALPFYQVMWSPSGMASTTLQEAGRRYIWRGTFDILCWDEDDAGNDGLYAMAEAAKMCVENKRISNDKGSVAFFAADQGGVEVLGEKALIELQVPYEHADRR